LEASDYTSIQQRLRDPTNESEKTTIPNRQLKAPLKPVAGLDPGDLVPTTLGSYIELVTWTGTHVRPEGKAMLANSPTAPPEVLKKLHTPPGTWLRQVQGVESRYYRALGSAELLILKAREISQSWLKGVGVARALQRANLFN